MNYSRTRTGQGFGHLPKARQYIQAAHQESGHVLFAQGCRNPYPAGDIRRCPVGTHCASHSYTRKALLLMLLNILLLIFCAIPFGVSILLYKNNKRFMATFYVAMARSGNARKLYVQVWLICLLLFHYVYACGHMGEFGILLSTGVCAAMFSFRRTDNWLRRLLDRPPCICHTRIGRTGHRLCAASVHLGDNHCLSSSGSPVLSLRSGHVRMQGYGHTFRMGKASRNAVRILSRQSSRKSAA